MVGFAAPASGHEEIHPATFPANTPTFFTLSAADDEKVNLVKLALSAPAGIPLGGATREPAGWAVAKTQSSITWTPAKGSQLHPGQFAEWGFETDGAPQPGAANWKVTLGYADGKTDDVIVPATVTAGAAAAAPSPIPPPIRPSNGRANAALIVGIVAGVLALLALLLAALGRFRRASAQDW